MWKGPFHTYIYMYIHIYIYTKPHTRARFYRQYDRHWSVKAMCCDVLQCVAVCCSVLQCVAVHCSVLQSFAECCSVLQCVAVLSTMLPATQRHTVREHKHAYMHSLSHTHTCIQEVPEPRRSSLKIDCFGDPVKRCTLQVRLFKK